jgi:hypothetical protein
MWDFNGGFTFKWFKHTIEQKWYSTVFNLSKRLFYRIIKYFFLS